MLQTVPSIEKGLLKSLSHAVKADDEALRVRALLRLLSHGTGP
jgi:hypothetical protein